MHSHSHDASHPHSHASPPKGRGERNRLLAALVCTSFILVAEAVGGFLTGSLALISDAGHMLIDSLALLLSFVAMEMAQRASSPRFTFGLKRVEILVALVNGLSLLVICGIILTEGVNRLVHPPPVDAPVMTGIAVVGLVANAVSAYLLRDSTNLNVRSAFLHVLGDLFSSVGIIVAGIAMMAWQVYWIDPALSIVIALVIVFGAWRVIREVVEILMEAGPRHLDVSAIQERLVAQTFVVDVHDLHLWTITSGFTALSCHVVLSGTASVDHDEAVERLSRLLREEYGIEHATIQVESSHFSAPSS